MITEGHRGSPRVTGGPSSSSRHRWQSGFYGPVLGGDKAQLLQLPLLVHPSGLPPLVIAAVHHVENLPKVKVQSLGQNAAVPLLVVVKKRPETKTQLSQNQVLFLLAHLVLVHPTGPDQVTHLT